MQRRVLMTQPVTVFSVIRSCRLLARNGQEQHVLEVVYFSNVHRSTSVGQVDCRVAVRSHVVGQFREARSLQRVSTGGNFTYDRGTRSLSRKISFQSPEHGKLEEIGRAHV